MGGSAYAALGRLMLGGIARPTGFSRRRAFLITVGLGWAGYGWWGVISDPRYGTSRGLSGITQWVPMGVLGWVWVMAGLLALVAGLLVNCPRVQAAGFAGLATPAALWGTAFLVSAVTSYPSGAGSACGWLSFALAVLWVSGMDDPPPPYLRKRVS
ncbi:hypothetical protein [Streptomyces hirsutus]|uniref:hypothetical protein n=1 Tax=Streptomyces hirsutus TaxID=35620 RepID=UPI00365EF272